jgi:integrase
MLEKRTQIDVEPITPEEWRRVQPNLPEWAQLLCDLLWFTGLRVSEALAIKRDKINRDDRGRWTIEVQRAKKGPESTIVIPESLARRLLDYRRPRHVRSPLVFGGGALLDSYS